MTDENARASLRTQPSVVEACPLCADWASWEKDLKKAAVGKSEPATDEEMKQFRHALADVRCKDTAQERYEVEYRLGRFGAKLWRKILARLDAAEAALSQTDEQPDTQGTDGLAGELASKIERVVKFSDTAMVCIDRDLAKRILTALRRTDRKAVLEEAYLGKAWLGGFNLRSRVTKIKGSNWTGKVVGFYSTDLTPEGYAVESETEKGSVQIYPRAALRALAEGEGK